MKDKMTGVARSYLLNHGKSVETHDGVAEAGALLKRLWPVTTPLALRRFGGTGDGAYLLPDDLEGIQAVISPGVSVVATFEGEMAQLGMECFLIDASVEASPVIHERIHFTRKFLGLHDGGEFVRLDSYVDDCVPGDSDLLLQMDIEGAEWSVLASVSAKLLQRFRIIVVEFHYLERLLYIDSYRAVLDRLLVTHHVIHTHVNNAGTNRKAGSLSFPEFLELTFLRKDRAPVTGYVLNLPHDLDVINVPSRPPLDLPACWYASKNEGFVPAGIGAYRTARSDV